ncbi:MAG: late competence protein ComER [Novibacillus thermophilus]|nr:late competence protein ComER [Novibacillus thermophilus]
MAKIGFIGTGNMGQILIEAFLKAGALGTDDIFIYNRTHAKARQLAARHPGIHIAPNNRTLVENSEIILICVKPLEYGNVLDDIQDVVQPEHLVISITSPVLIRDIEERIPAKVAKVVPSITNSVLCGAALVMFGSRLTSDDRKTLFRLFRHISRPIEINEAHVRVSSDLASCAPAFLCLLMQRFAESASDVAGIPRETAVSLVNEMILGVGKLLTEGGFSLESLQERVAVPGGVTRDGLNVLDQELGTVFQQLFHMTQHKHEKDLQHVQRMFYEHT